MPSDGNGFVHSATKTESSVLPCRGMRIDDGFSDEGFHVAAGSPGDMGVATGLVADGVRGVDLGRPVVVVAAALPGSATAAAAAAVIAAWSARGVAVAEDLAAHAAALTASGDTYRLVDAAVLDALSPRPER